MNIVLILINIIGAITFIFIYWKKLREDFGSDAIFTSAFYIIIGILVAFLVSVSFFRSLWFWAGFAGIIFGLILSFFRFKLKPYETIEAVVIAFLPWLCFVFIYDSIVAKSVGSVIFTLIIFTLVVVYLLFDKHYKKFTWYKSGRVGFSGLSVLGLFFSARAVIALTPTTVLSFTGKSDAILSAVVAFLAFISVFNLAQKS